MGHRRDLWFHTGNMGTSSSTASSTVVRSGPCQQKTGGSSPGRGSQVRCEPVRVVTQCDDDPVAAVHFGLYRRQRILAEPPLPVDQAHVGSSDGHHRVPPSVQSSPRSRRTSPYARYADARSSRWTPSSATFQSRRRCQTWSLPLSRVHTANNCAIVVNGDQGFWAFA